jgi:hypothetical protein
LRAGLTYDAPAALVAEYRMERRRMPIQRFHVEQLKELTTGIKGRLKSKLTCSTETVD